jgi:hypothetical protein
MAEAGKPIVPYVEWAILTEFTYLPGTWFRVLLEIEGSAADFAAIIEKSAGLVDSIRVASIYQTPSHGFKKGLVTFCTAIMTQKALEELSEEPKGLTAEFSAVKALIKRVELGPPATPFEPSPAKVVEPQSARPPPTAIIAVIDDGLAFAHDSFRSQGKTRFKYFWNQDDTTGTNPPAGFGWGRELPESEINALLTSCTHSGIVDEDELYEKAGQELVARRIKHGNHVMDIACGPDPVDPTYQPPYLIGVQLPRWVTEETSGGLLTPAVYDAITYILNRADQIAFDEQVAPLPIVVNISYGTIAGPHDGTGVFETAIDQLIAGRPNALCVVLPAGNHYLARCHARFHMPGATAGDSPIQQLNWRIQPDDKANSFVEIWLPEFAVDGTRPRVDVRLTTPTGEVTPWVQPGHRFPPPLTPSARYLVQSFDPAGERPRIIIAVASTASPGSNPHNAPSGTWLIEVRNEGAEMTAEAWVQRGDTPFGYPLWGRQSRFDDAHYKRFDLAGRPWQEDTDPSYIRRHGSINALATGQYSIVIGGFRRNDRTATEYSGAGPVATPLVVPPPRTGPDASAVADDSKVRGGILAAGTRSRSVAAMDGTSIAAPQVTRLIAEWMAKGLPSDRAAVEAYAAGVDPSPPAPGSALEERIGKGRIERPEPVALRLRGW